MSVTSCPTALIHAPAATVWHLLTQPAGWGAVLDMRVDNLDPPGPASEGQKVYGRTGPFRLRLKIELLKIDAPRSVLEMNIELPFGLNVREELNCIPLGNAQCRVNYRCEFRLPPGLRGALLRLILRRQLYTGPADSLARLKRAAEKAYRGQVGQPNNV